MKTKKSSLSRYIAVLLVVLLVLVAVPFTARAQEVETSSDNVQVQAASFSVSVHTMSTSQLFVSWSKGEGATSFDIYRSYTSGGPYVRVASGVTTPYFMDGGLGSDTYYYYMIVANNGTEGHGSGKTLPVIPDILVQVSNPTSHSLDVSWNQIPGALEYIVYRSVDPNGSYTQVGVSSELVFYDTNLDPNTTYYYKVVALAGSSNERSNTSNGTTLPLPQYIVTFDSNGGTAVAPDSMTVVHPDTTLDALPNNPSREGYTFVEWNTQADGLSTTFFADTVITESLTVYAQWMPEPVTPPIVTPVNPPVDPPVNPPVNPPVDTPANPPVDSPVVPSVPESHESLATTTPVEGGGTTGTTTGQTSDGASPKVLTQAAEAQGMPTIGVPLAAPSGFAAWALLNLVLMVIGVAAVLVFSIMRSLRKEDGNENEEHNESRGQNVQSASATEGAHDGASQEGKQENARKRTAVGWFVGSLVFALAGIVLFVLTENLALPMVWLDSWTLVQFALFALTAITSILAARRKKLSHKDDASENAKAGSI